MTDRCASSRGAASETGHEEPLVDGTAEDQPIQHASADVAPELFE